MTSDNQELNAQRKALSTKMSTQLDEYTSDAPTELTDTISVVGESVLSQANRLTNATPREAIMVNESLSRCNHYLSTCQNPDVYLPQHSGLNPVTPGLCNLGQIGILGQKFSQSDRKEYQEYGEALLTFSVVGALGLPFRFPNDEEKSSFHGTDHNDYLPFTLNFIGVPTSVSEGITTCLSNDAQVFYEPDKAPLGYTAEKASQTVHTLKEQLHLIREEAEILTAAESVTPTLASNSAPTSVDDSEKLTPQTGPTL